MIKERGCLLLTSSFGLWLAEHNSHPEILLPRSQRNVVFVFPDAADQEGAQKRVRIDAADTASGTTCYLT